MSLQVIFASPMLSLKHHTCRDVLNALSLVHCPGFVSGHAERQAKSWCFDARLLSRTLHEYHRLLQGQEEVQMPKHKMWLKRCQRESQEQDPPPGSAQPDLGSMVPPAEPAPFTNISAQSAQPLPAEPADQAPASTQGELEPACTARPILQGAMQLPESSVLPAPILVAPVMPAAGAAGAHDSSPVAGSPQQGEQGLSRHAQASPQPRVYRVQPSEPSQASARQMQPRVNRAESGEPLQATPDAELLPERQLQSWQSLSAKPAAVPPPVRVRRGTPAGRLASPRPAVQGLQHGEAATVTATHAAFILWCTQGAQCVTSMTSIVCKHELHWAILTADPAAA